MPLKPRRRTQSDSAANADKGSDAESDEDASGRRVCESQGVPDAAGGKGSSRKYAWAVGLVVVAAIALVLLAFITGVITGGESDVSHDRSDAKLERRVQELTAALDGAFENDEAGVLPRSVEAGMQIVREIVHETLKRRERQLQKHTIQRAVTFHFAGDFRDQENSNQTSRMFTKVAAAIEQFVMSDHEGRPDKARSALHIGNDPAGWYGTRKRVADYLKKYPKAVVVIHNADKVPDNFERLYDLEDAFEMPRLQNEGVQIRTTGAVFILQSSLGPALTNDVCGGPCASSHRWDLVKRVKEQSQAAWTRQAFVARIRDIVPFAI